MATGIAVLAFLSLSYLAGEGGEANLQAEENVAVTAKLSQNGVHGGASLRAALLVTVRRGWHINSASPGDENLIATSAAFSIPPGLDTADVRYPRGVPTKFTFSDRPLDVYEGTVVIRLKITAAAGIKPGTYTVPVEISYQACNNDVCCAPAAVQILIPVQVLGPDVAPAPANPGLFTQSTDQ